MQDTSAGTHPTPEHLQYATTSSVINPFIHPLTEWAGRGFRIAAVGIALSAIWLAGCTSPTSPGEKAIQTNVPLTAAPNLGGPGAEGVVVWRSPDLAEHEQVVTSYYIPPATVYHGSGSSFDGLSPAQVDQIAAQMTEEVRRSVGQHFKVVNEPGPRTFTLQLVLVNIIPPHETNIENGPYPWSQELIGMPNASHVSNGRIVVAGKFIDSATSKLLVGFVAPVTPQMMQIAQPLDTSQTVEFARAASRQFATDLTNAIVRQRELARRGQGQ